MQLARPSGPVRPAIGLRQHNFPERCGAGCTRRRCCGLEHDTTLELDVWELAAKLVNAFGRSLFVAQGSECLNGVGPHRKTT